MKQPKTCRRYKENLKHLMGRTVLFAALSCLLLLPPLLGKPSPSLAADSNTAIIREIDHLIANGGYILLKNNTVLVQKNQETLFVPASTLKICTALASLHILGEDFRFRTEFYTNKKNDLYIKGFGDPFLTSEEVAAILTTLRKLGVTEINNIFLDASSFQLEEKVAGSSRSLNPYDAQNSALAANFNTVNLEKLTDGTIRSAEPQTPTLPIMRRLGRTLPAGTHRINLTNDKTDILIHTGELFRALQQRTGIAGAGVIESKSAPEHVTLLYEHRSTQALREIIEGLMLYSNNFIANQLFLTCGAQEYGYPATWQKGRTTIAKFLLSMGLDQEAVTIQEGSGLSRENRITPAAMLHILQAFAPYAPLLPFENGRLIKSGTLQDVYAYAGYLTERKEHDPFVLILNQRKNLRDQVLNLLEKLYRQP